MYDTPLPPDLVPPDGVALAAYLLGGLEWEPFLALQRRLIYDVSGGQGEGVLVVCEHPSGISIGRAGSRLHLRQSSDESSSRGRPIRWLARGGGVMLHAPGQIAVYPILPLGHLGLTPVAYVQSLSAAIATALSQFGVAATVDDKVPGVVVGSRRIAHVGVAIRYNVTAFGAVVNVTPDLAPFRLIDCDGCHQPMTSLAREAQSPVRIASVRQVLVDEIARQFGYARVSVFHNHPELAAGPTRHASVATPGCRP